MVPNVKSMDSQREKNACDAILQAVVQRSQLIPKVLDMINETWTKIRGEVFVSSFSNDKDGRVEQDEQFQFDSTNMQGVPISWKRYCFWCVVG